MKRCVAFAIAAVVLAARASDIGPGEGDAESNEQSTVTAPPDKANSPGTDLENYPKLPQPVEALEADETPTAPPPTFGDVSSFQINSDGSGTVTTYTPPQGLTAEQLYEALQEQGVQGLMPPDSPSASYGAVGPTALTSCAYGTSTLFRCSVDTNPAHQLHWANNGYAHPQVYFVDHTGSQWPTNVSTYVWNRAHGIDSTYVWGRCPGYRGTHCVNLVDHNYGNSCWQGLTTVSWDSKYNIQRASVSFNDYNGTGVCRGVRVNYAKNANGYRQDACHEMGHALGMGHNRASSGSCLFGTITNSGAVLAPSNQDFTLIARLYSTGH